VFDLVSGLKVVRDRRHAVGASTVTGADIDAFAAVAIELNSRANGCRVAVMHHNVLDDEVSEVVVILARKCWYDAALADQRWRGSIGLALAGSRFWWVVTRPLVPADQRPGRACPL
jgi:predicted nicotinamide N-methyase